MRSLSPRFAVRASLLVLLLGALAACSTPEVATQGAIHDPYEEQNRRTHEASKRFDRALVRPIAIGYTTIMPDGIEDNINNLASTLNTPNAMINQVLQGDFSGATHNLVRFSINATFGFAGLADVAADWGLEQKDADFGQTLAVWGVPQGAYLVLPFFGPSTERAAVGILVDIAINPLSGRLYPDPALPAPYDLYATTARFASGFSARGRFTNTIDSVLYESADDYTATRDIYLQNRAFELEQVGVVTDDAVDPYADIFGE